MTDADADTTAERAARNLRNIRDHFRSGRFGQREVWEQQLEEAAVLFDRAALPQHQRSEGGK